MIKTGDDMFFIETILKEFFMSVGFIRMDVENGLMLLEIHLLTKY